MFLLVLAHLPFFSPILQSAPGAPQQGNPQANTPAAASAQNLPVFEVLPLAHAEAGEVAGSLRNFLQGGERVMPDARTNALILMVAGDHLAEIKALISELDRAVPAKSAGGTARSIAPEGQDDLFAPVTRDLVIELGEGGTAPNLLAIARQYERLTGQMFLVSAEVETLLTNTPSGLGASVNVPAEGVQTFVEHLFAFNSCYFVPRPGSSPRLIEVFSWKSQDRNNFQQRSYHVAAQDVEAFSARHPAVPIVTIYTMKNVDVRLLSNSMRSILPDGTFAFMLPAGATNSMVLGGLSSVVVQQLELLRIVEEGSTSEQPAASVPPEAAK